MQMLTDGLGWWTRRFRRALAPTTTPVPAVAQPAPKSRRARAQRAPRDPEREGAPATGRFARGALRER
jgi:hypothetical protein